MQAIRATGAGVLVRYGETWMKEADDSVAPVSPWCEKDRRRHRRAEDAGIASLECSLLQRFYQLPPDPGMPAAADNRAGVAGQSCPDYKFSQAAGPDTGQGDVYAGDVRGAQSMCPAAAMPEAQAARIPRTVPGGAGGAGGPDAAPGAQAAGGTGTAPHAPVEAVSAAGNGCMVDAAEAEGAAPDAGAEAVPPPVVAMAAVPCGRAVGAAHRRLRELLAKPTGAGAAAVAQSLSHAASRTWTGLDHGVRRGAHPGATSEPGSALAWHFRQWGPGSSVTIEQRGNTLLMRASDSVVAARLGDALQREGQPNWTLESATAREHRRGGRQRGHGDDRDDPA